MHKILFENKLSTYSPFSPFCSYKNSMPGIITKIKNKIQDLFQPSINSSSTIQRIQCYNEQNQDKELSYQNNLVIVDHIIPNKEHIPTSKRKTLYPFDLYLQELISNQNQISDKPIINKPIQIKDQQPYINKAKKQMKFKKNHAKIEQSIKMEDNSSQIDLQFNQKSQNFQLQYSSDFLSNHSIKKKIKCRDNTIESPSQVEQTNGQISQINQFEIQSFENIKQNQQISCQQLSDQNNRISDTQNRHSCNIVNFKQFIQENQYFSSSTGTNTKGETQEAIFNMEHISFSQETDSSISEEKYSIDNSFEIQNKLYSIFHPDLQDKSNLQSNQNQNRILDELNQISQDISESPKQQIKKQKKLILDSEIISIQIQCNPQKSNNQIEKLQQQEFKCQQINKSIENNNNNQNIFLSDPLENNQKIIDQQLQNEYQKELLQKQIDEKLESPQSQNNTLLSMNCESTTNNTNIIQENDKPKEFNIKPNQILKQNNPFLDTSTNISQDQVSQYFLQGLLTGNSQYSQQQQIIKDQNTIDLFKMQNNNQLFNFNILVENQGYQQQNLYNQQYLTQKNDQCLIYNKMEIIDQIPLSNQFNSNQYNNYQQPIQNYYQPTFEQKQYHQPISFQQSQQPWIGQQSSIQQQNPYSQIQQSSFQISSINLFQSNSSMANSNPNCCQEESTINQIYTKQDVLSFFQDTNKKQDQNLFTLDSIQSSNTQQQVQNLNNSFNRGYRKKQRINNN